MTGSSGFIGKSVTSFHLIKRFSFFEQGDNLKINETVVLNFAGKAHDLKKGTSPDEYYHVNIEFAKQVFEAFITSEAKVFMTLSSVKAVSDEVSGQLTEEAIPSPVTHYEKSKLLGGQYILSKDIPEGKWGYVLRPCMIHGVGNKRNLNSLYDLASKGRPWSLGDFKNSRSYCSTEDLCFIIKELTDRNDIPCGIYNVSDDEPISTNQVVGLIAESMGKPAWVLNLSRLFIRAIAHLGDFLKLASNIERLQKLTESYVVSNHKIKRVLGKSLPLTSSEGLCKIFRSFSSNA